MRQGRCDFFDKIGVGFQIVAQSIEERRLEATEAVVETGDVWTSETETSRVALGSETIDVWAAGVGQAHHLGALVKGLAGSVVDCLAEHLHIEGRVDAYNLRVSARYEQTEIGKLGDAVALVLLHKMS